MIKLLAIGMGGGLGAMLRYWVSGWVYATYRSVFPGGTYIVNIIGSFLLGFLMAYFESHDIPENFKFFLTTGLLGAFTTFSTFSYETLMLIQINAYGRAAAYSLLSVSIGLLMAVAGFYLARSLSA